MRRLGDRLRDEGYKGFFEVDVLVDLDSDHVYLGELNPRISGASSMTNVTAGAYADIPLFLFHLLEFMNIDYQVDVDEINERWRELAAVDVWAQLIMKEPNDAVERILAQRQRQRSREGPSVSIGREDPDSRNCARRLRVDLRLRAASAPPVAIMSIILKTI